MKFPTGVLLLIVPLFGGCIAVAGDGQHLGRADRCEYAITMEYIEGSEMVEGNGTLRWFDIEGGFWGIEADDGRKFMPTGAVCEDLREDGLRIHFAGRTRPDAMGIQMWGVPLDLTLIERA